MEPSGGTLESVRRGEVSPSDHTVTDSFFMPYDEVEGQEAGPAK